ncbi:nucleotide sugar dehydrogenase [Halobellus inordinatus]|uniref:nucleotide sugar dehydrogenase n=1 Tax=Halobellus inordinatus TaxID=1126236 RepID=UPI0021094700|nr:nucleotide sugar dehydrogenase [Halobellus inordinatus]
MDVYSADAGIDFDIGRTTVAVFGLGKMGLPLAAVVADAGADVIGVDIDETVVDAVNAGECPVKNEPQLPELVDRYAGNRLEATTDGAAAAEAADITVMLVPTIVDDDNQPILDPVLAAAEDISAGLSSGDLVVLESTVPPGTTEDVVVETVETGNLTAGEDFGVAYCPERTYAGRVVEDLTESYPKIVGGLDRASTTAAARFYEAFNEPGVIELGSPRAAEAIKVFEGVYRDTNIALANELGKVCEQWGIDSEEVFEAANTQPFCDIHVPGIGVGGHCIPVYPHFVIERADDTPLQETSRAVNDGMPTHAVSVLESLLAGQERPLGNANILVLGITYRAGVHETRYAPALDVINHLREQGAETFAHDPLLDTEEIRESGATPVSDPLAVDDLDGVVLATAHDEYEQIDLDDLADKMRSEILVDGRRFFDRDAVDSFTYARIGDGTSATKYE